MCFRYRPLIRVASSIGESLHCELTLHFHMFRSSAHSFFIFHWPLTTVAAAIGPELLPIACAALYAWKMQGMHTVSVGFACGSDLDEVIDAARLYMDATGKTDALLEAAEARDCCG